MNKPAAAKRPNSPSCMDGKGCWRDNVFVERLWREEVYLYACDSVNDAKRGLEKYFRL